MFSIFGQHCTKGPIKLDAFLIKSFRDIHESLILPKTCEEIRACIDRQNED